MAKGSEHAAGLHKNLSLPQIVALYIGAVIGSGVLLIPGLAAEKAGPASIIAWLVMSILVIPMALTMGLLSAKHPNAGGVSHFVRLAFGDRYGNMVGWFFLLSVPIGAPILAVTGSNYLGVLIGLGDLQIYLVASLILLSSLVINYFGMQVAGQVQTVVISLIIAILLLAIFTAMPQASPANFTPFLPHGWLSVVQAAELLFWCFIGWEAVTHLSEEFVDPEKNAIRGVLWSSGLVALLYFGIAFMTVATHSYGEGISAASLSVMVQMTLGPVGGWVVAVTALFICIATANAYIGAASRIAYSLAGQGIAPRWFGILHSKYRTPVGGLGFLLGCFVLVITVLAAKLLTLATIIELPNATFFATYIGGCVAGVRLLKGNRVGNISSWVSLIVTGSLYPFLGWSALYPFAIVIVLHFVEKRKANRVLAA